MTGGVKINEIMASGERKPAVFLDRDGVLTEEKSYIDSVEKLCIFPYAAECIRKIQEKGYYAIVVTNQSGVARGLFSEDELRRMNAYLIRETKIDAVYYCPHHPAGAVEKYKMECDCRKPKTGMFQAACRDFAINLAKSYMVGDRAGDILAGQNLGIRTVLLESGYGTGRLEADVVPGHIFTDLRDLLEIL